MSDKVHSGLKGMDTRLWFHYIGQYNSIWCAWIRSLRPIRRKSYIPHSRRFCLKWASTLRHIRAQKDAGKIIEVKRASRLRRLFCFFLTFRRHWWKYYPDKRRYVVCRVCKQLPKGGQWNQLQKIKE